jgi:hypothetical protein
VAEVIQTHMIIGPDSSKWTERIPFPYIQILLNMGILKVSEVIDHGATPNGVSVQTVVYRAKIENKTAEVPQPESDQQDPIVIKFPPRGVERA